MFIFEGGRERQNEWVKVRERGDRGACVAQAVERPTSAQVMISQSVSSSPASGSVLTAQSPELALGFHVSLSLGPSPTCVLSLSLSLFQGEINILLQSIT